MQRLMNREIGRPVPVLSHLGETGDSLSNEANDFWDNATEGAQGDQTFVLPNQSPLRTPPVIENIKKNSKKQTYDSMEDDVLELQDG
ncbi:hypothetical protein AVEN_146942-1 [Araneus ventricosus]|uniref:Uncharacterized protein n=1 Tax=Araneus ventricosus TaxID=182803 RepID=A0A4Y2M5Y9_ARAVE|nr:hypothetical protein AVEN_146942-1 [Araneus ventricosus]